MHIKIEEAIQRLQQGEVVAIPTETVYGLAADARNTEALQQVFDTKQRPNTNPLIVHIASQSAAYDWVQDFPPLAKSLAEAFWPGPLTLVLKAKQDVLPIVTANQPTVALRVPSHPVALDLLTQSGLGLAAPSANRYTQLSPTRSEHVVSGLGVRIPVIDGGPCQVGLESTIVEVYEDTNGEMQWQLLREGMITRDEVKAVAQQAPVSKQHATLAPGQHQLHYAPQTALTLCKTREEMISQGSDLVGQSKKVAIMSVGEIEPIKGCHLQILPSEPVGYAQQLYDALHQLDHTSVDIILAEVPPNAIAWSAIHDRLARAAHSSP